MSKDNQPTMQDFMDSFDEAFFDCIDNGTAKRLSCQVGERVVTVTIQEAGKDQVDFDKLLQQAVRNRVGVIS